VWWIPLCQTLGLIQLERRKVGIWETEPQEWCREVDINLAGAFNCLRVIPSLIDENLS
jgi:NAD(P)-dependent dehydrogenase (short-subunit alcohol dehydrogenase family)